LQGADTAAEFAATYKQAVDLTAASSSTPGEHNFIPVHGIGHEPTLNASAAPTAAAPAQLPVSAAFGSDNWGSNVGQQVRWMVGHDQSRAELVLTPPHMGKVEISLTINGDQTTAQFVSANSEVRDALEQALPRLREMLAASGITLGQANVNAESTRDGMPQFGSDSSRGTPQASSAAPAVWVRQSNGLIDTFA